MEELRTENQEQRLKPEFVDIATNGKVVMW